jgi:hypothetical protein
MIARTLEALERVAGRRPVGWLSPGLTETYEQILDWYSR